MSKLYFFSMMFFSLFEISQAGILYNDIPDYTVVPSGDPFNPDVFDIDFDNNGIVDFKIVGHDVSVISVELPETTYTPANNDLLGSPVVPLSFNEFWDGTGYTLASQSNLLVTDCRDTPAGVACGGNFNWETFNDEYIGALFEINGDTHFGWIGVDARLGALEIRDWAYETNPNTGIVVGAIPEPGSLSLILLGGLALYFRRRFI